jgi:hypothetical protein
MSYAINAGQKSRKIRVLTEEKVMYRLGTSSINFLHLKIRIVASQKFSSRYYQVLLKLEPYKTTGLPRLSLSACEAGI